MLYWLFPLLPWSIIIDGQKYLEQIIFTSKFPSVIKQITWYLGKLIKRLNEHSLSILFSNVYLYMELKALLLNPYYTSPPPPFCLLTSVKIERLIISVTVFLLLLSGQVRWFFVTWLLTNAFCFVNHCNMMFCGNIRQLRYGSGRSGFMPFFRV